MWSTLLKRTNSLIVVTAKVSVRNYSCISNPIHYNNLIVGFSSSSNCNINNSLFTRFLMAGVEGLIKNAKIADDLITEISEKIQKMNPNPELEQLRAKNEELRREVEKWKEILTCAEIRQGQEPYYYTHYVVPENKDEVKPVENSKATAQEAKTTPAPSGNNEKQPKGKKNKENESKQQQQQADPNANVNTEHKRAPEGEVKEEVKAAKQPKKNQNKGEGKAAPAASAPATEVVDVSRLDLRIGKIVEVDKHPEADALYLEKIDVGEEKPRTVISGLVKHVPLEEMRDRLVVVLCNLKPAKMRGITSEAMVMCASSPDKVEILTPPAGVVPGDVIEFEGYPRNPDSVLNPKKKIFETVAPDLKTDDNKVATYKGVPFMVKGKGVVVAATLSGVNVK